MFVVAVFAAGAGAGVTVAGVEIEADDETEEEAAEQGMLVDDDDEARGTPLAGRAGMAGTAWKSYCCRCFLPRLWSG